MYVEYRILSTVVHQRQITIKYYICVVFLKKNNKNIIKKSDIFIMVLIIQLKTSITNTLR